MLRMKRMNSSILSSCDDLTKYLVLDPYLGFHTKKVTKLKINVNNGCSDKLQEIINLYKFNNNKQATISALIKFCDSNDNLLYKFNISKRKWIENHINMYLECLSSQSQVLILMCRSYAFENYEGVAVVAKTTIKSNTVISNLKGIKKYVSEVEVKILESQNIDFSIMSSTKSKRPILFLGTAALINHHCTPNCEYKAINSSEVVIIAIKDIEVNEELFCFYDSDYFDDKNVNCECSDCKKKKTAQYSDGSSEKQVSNYINDINSEVSENLRQSKDQYSFEIKKGSFHTSSLVSNNSIKIDNVNKISKLDDSKCSTVMNKKPINTEHAINEYMVNNENNSFKYDELLSIYCSIKKFNNFVKELKIDEKEIYDDDQRRVHLISGQGLKYNNCRYTKLIKFLKFKQRIQIAENYIPSEEDLRNIVKELYNNNHANNYRSVSNFIANHKTRISSDIEENGNFDIILAPGFEEMEEYFYKLTKIMISTCYEEFAICIYDGGKIRTELKNIILKQLSAGSKVTVSDRSKLDNYLKKYKPYLREVAKKLSVNVTTDVYDFFENNQPNVTLSRVDLSVIKSDSIALLENNILHSEDCSVNIKLNDSMSSLTVDQLKNIIGIS